MKSKKLYPIVKNIQKGIDLLSVRAESRTFLLIVLVFVSCRNVSKVDSSSIINEKPEVVLDSIVLEAKPKEVVIDEDCVFDLFTQTDDFLKEIKEFEGYVWNSETKTAEVNLSDDYILKIHRGGCDHFSVAVNFEYKNEINFEGNKDLIFNQIIWATSLLNDFDGIIIKEVIEKGHLSITKEDSNNYHMNFMDNRVYELYYMYFKNEEGMSSFGISFWMD